MNNLHAFESFVKKDKKITPKGNNAVIYTRVSHSSQEDNTSLETQLKNCEAFAQRKGYQVIEHFGGTYESAKTDDRKEFNRMLEFLKKNRTVTAIIVYSYERFTRSGVQGAKIAEDLLKNKGIVTLSVTQELDPNTISGMFQQQIFFMFSRMDNEMRREKTITGMTELVRKGVIPYSIPRGYTNANRGGRAIDQKLVINEEGEFLKKAFEWKYQFNYSDAEICRKLAEIGYKIDPRRLGPIFKNPFYCGLITSQFVPNEIIEGKHPPMISQEVFLAINKIKAEKNFQAVTKTNDNDFLPLRRFVKCSNCGGNLTGYIVKKKNIYYYKCKHSSCKTTKNANDLHTMFERFISKMKINQSLFPEIEKSIRNIFFNRLNEKKEDIQLWKRTENELASKIEAIEERFVLGEISKEQFQKFAKRFKEQLANIKDKLDSNLKINSNLEKCIVLAKELLSKPNEIWASSDYVQKRKLQNLIFPDGIFYNKGKDRILTGRINSFFQLIYSLSTESRSNKKGGTINFDNSSFLVIVRIDPTF